MKNFILVALLLFASSGCIDQQPIDLPTAQPRIVIDGLISNKEGESYIIIGWSAAVNSSCRDNFGNMVACEPATSDGPFKINGVVRIIEKNTAAIFELPLKMNDKEGMILLTPDIKGKPGYTYSLEIEFDYNGNTEFYSATTKMLSTPPITDITYEIRKGDVGKSDNLVPLISFTEPVEKNFYLFQLCSIHWNTIACGNSRVWSYSLIADTFLPPEVKGLSIDDGASIAKYAEFYPPPEPGTVLW